MILLKEKKYVFDKDISKCVKLTKSVRCFAAPRIREIISSLHFLKVTLLRKLILGLIGRNTLKSFVELRQKEKKGKSKN